MLTNLNRSIISLIRSLRYKKYRDESGLFVIEGEKSVLEVLSSDCNIHLLLCTPEFFDKNSKLLGLLRVETVIIDQNRLSELGSFQSNNTALAACRKLEAKEVETNNSIIAIDSIRDPGNLGTIIRTAHWFGIRNVVCSPDTVDLYNSKVLQACMGSFLHVNVVYTSLKGFLPTTNQQIFGTFTTGTNIYESKIPSKSTIVVGNESHGISREIERLIHHRITIPRFSENIDSLNVAVATGLICGLWVGGKY